MIAARAPETATRTLAIAAGLSLLCSIAVALSAVLLKPRQEANRDRDRQRNVLEAAGLVRPGVDPAAVFRELIETRILDFETGHFSDDMDPAAYDHRRAAKDPALSVALAPEDDLAVIGRRERYVPVYLTHNEDGWVDRIILPVRGYGLWSTLWGYIALQGDGNTVIGLSFYEHAETPGLGGEVDNPEWKAHWSGKKVYPEPGRELDSMSGASYRPRPVAPGAASGWPALRVAKGVVQADDVAADYKVDGLAGATLTGRGINQLLQFWLGPEAYGPLLTRIRSRGMR